MKIRNLLTATMIATLSAFALSSCGENDDKEGPDDHEVVATGQFRLVVSFSQSVFDYADVVMEYGGADFTNLTSAPLKPTDLRGQMPLEGKDCGLSNCAYMSFKEAQFPVNCSYRFKFTPKANQPSQAINIAYFVGLAFDSGTKSKTVNYINFRRENVSPSAFLDYLNDWNNNLQGQYEASLDASGNIRIISVGQQEITPAG